MIDKLEYRIAELERKIISLISIGRIKELDCTKARVKVAYGEITTDWLPWLTRRAGNDMDWWAPEKGEQVLLVCPCGDPGLGVVLPAAYCRDYFPEQMSEDIHRTEYMDGAFTEYNRKTSTLNINIPGTVNIEASDSLNCTAPDINLTGNLNIEGPVKINGSLAQNGGKADFGSTVKALGRISSTSSVASPSIKAGATELNGHKHNSPKGITGPPL